MSVHDINEKKPHFSGVAKCLNCGHEWQTVSIEAKDLKCPNCALHKGCFKYSIVRGGLLFTCNCGNDLFHISPRGPYCPNCGNWATDWQGGPQGPQPA